VAIEMSCYRRLRSLDRRRHLRAYSRNDDTPRHLVIELNAAGTDYTVQNLEAVHKPFQRWEEVEAILANAIVKMTHKEIVAQCPEDRDPPERSTLYRWLRAATQEGCLCCSGSGAQRDPYHYWLPARAPMLRPDPGASAPEMQAWNNRIMEEVFERLEREQGRSDLQRLRTLPILRQGQIPSAGQEHRRPLSRIPHMRRCSVGSRA
jgi:hypothetical protein